MTYTFRQQLLDPKRYVYTHPTTKKTVYKSAYAMTPKCMTVHNTANDASAANEANYHNRADNHNSTTYHVAIDDKEAVQVLPFNRNGYHAGDGSVANGGNRTSIGIEICYSKSGGERYTKAEANAVHYIATLLKQYGWGVDCIKQHYDWSRKNCPHRIRDEKRWDSFIQRVQTELNTLNKPAIVAPQPIDNGTLVLPANISSWAVYKHSTGTFDKTIVGYLNPKLYGGLSYKVINSPFPNYFAIRTEKFGIVNILADGKRGESWIQPSKKVEAPQPTPTPQPSPQPQQPSKKYLKLPATVDKWRIYPTNKAPVEANAIGSLNPKKHGGLTYEILGNPQAHVYTIQTRDFGKVNIYAAPSTGAIIQ